MSLTTTIQDFTLLLFEISFMPPNWRTDKRKLTLSYIENLYNRLFFFPVSVKIREDLIADDWTDEVLKNRLKTARFLLKDWITPDGIAQFETDGLLYPNLFCSYVARKHLFNEIGVADCRKYMMKVQCLFENANLAIKLVDETLKEIESLITPQPETPKEQEQTKSKLPPELDTPQAHIIWSKAKHNGWIDENFQFNGNRQQMCYAADIMGESLKLKDKWKPFIELWGYAPMAQTRWRGKKGYESIPKMNELKKIFSL